MATDQGSGMSSPVPFAYFDRDSCSWRMCQASLLEVSGEFCTTWPRQGTWDRGFVWELPTSEHLTDESESSSLLPTPSAYESTPTDDYTSEVREHLADTHKRLYLPGRKWHAQRTLSRMAGALLPTPGAGDSHGGEGPTRLARQEEGDTGGPALRDIGHLLPTPTAGLGDEGRGHRGQHPDKRAAGHSVTLEDVSTVWREEARRASGLLPTPTTQDAANTAGQSQQERNTPPLNTVVTELLPTPSAADGSGGRIDNAETTRTGKRPSGAKAELTLRSAVTHKLLPTPIGSDAKNPGAPDTPQLREIRSLLPTPVANPDNPGAGGELRAALEHGPGRRNETGVDSMGRPNRGRPSRLLPTPRAQDGKGHAAATDYELGREESDDLLHVRLNRLLPTPTGQDARQNALNEAEAQRNPATMWATMGRVQSGDHTSPRYGGGSTSSDEQHPDQLTLEDA